MPSLQFDIVIQVREHQLFGKTKAYHRVRCPDCQSINFVRPDRPADNNHYNCNGCHLRVHIIDHIKSILSDNI